MHKALANDIFSLIYLSQNKYGLYHIVPQNEEVRRAFKIWMSVVGNNKEPYESHIGSRMKKIAKKGNKQGVKIKSEKIIISSQ